MEATNLNPHVLCLFVLPGASVELIPRFQLEILDVSLNRVGEIDRRVVSIAEFEDLMSRLPSESVGFHHIDFSHYPPVIPISKHSAKETEEISTH